MDAVARRGSRSASVTASVTGPAFGRSGRQTPQTTPSWRTEPWPMRQLRPSAGRRRSRNTLLRSACESRTLSYSGRKRTGAGVSGSGRGASGRSKSSRPSSPRKARRRGRRRSTTSRSPVSRHQVVTSATVAGPNAATYRRTTSSSDGRRASGRPSHDSAVASLTCEVAPQTPRGGTWTSASLQRQARASAAGSRPGNRSAEHRSELGARERLLRERRGRVREDGREVDALEGGRRVAVPSQLGVQHRLHQRPEQEAVLGGDEVDRPAHDDDPHDVASDEAVGERLRSEAVDP